MPFLQSLEGKTWLMHIVLIMHWTLFFYITRVQCRAMFKSGCTPGPSLTFLSTISLHNLLLKSIWYIEYVISTILEKIVTLIGYSLLKFQWKKKQRNHMLNNYTSFWCKKHPIFALGLIITIRSSLYVWLSLYILTKTQHNEVQWLLILVMEIWGKFLQSILVHRVLSGVDLKVPLDMLG